MTGDKRDGERGGDRDSPVGVWKRTKTRRPLGIVVVSRGKGGGKKENSSIRERETPTVRERCCIAANMYARGRNERCWARGRAPFFPSPGSSIEFRAFQYDSDERFIFSSVPLFLSSARQKQLRIPTSTWGGGHPPLLP